MKERQFGAELALFYDPDFFDMYQSSFVKHILYWILPTVVTLSCILIYFHDFFGGSHLIAHPINREFGVVENLQLIILGIIVFTALKGVKKSEHKHAKKCFSILTAIAILLILEEVDYGLHYWEYFTLPVEKRSEIMQLDYDTNIRNLHNNGEITNITKLLSYGLIIILFAIVPLLPNSFKERYKIWKYLSPSKFIIATTISLLLTNNVALYFYRHLDYQNQALNGNISEFEEIMTYYIFMLYIAEMVYSARLSGLFSYLKAKQKKNKTIQVGYSGLKNELR